MKNVSPKLNVRVWVLACGLGLFSACGKKPAPRVGPEPGPPPAAIRTTAAAPQTVQPIVLPPAAPDSTATLDALTQALRKYAVERRTMPKSFSEVVAAGYVKNLPTPPSGKKFEIDPKTARVVLVNQ